MTASVGAKCNSRSIPWRDRTRSYIDWGRSAGSLARPWWRSDSSERGASGRPVGGTGASTMARIIAVWSVTHGSSENGECPASRWYNVAAKE